MSNAIVPADSAASGSIPSVTIPVKLTSTNYLLWKAQLQPLLSAYDLMSHVDGTAPSPPSLIDNEPNPAYLSWFKKNQLVLSWIICSVTEGLLPQIVGADSALTAWQRLAAAYTSGSKAQILNLKSQLSSLCRGNDSIPVYLQRSKTLADHLAALGSPVTIDDLIHSITEGLGADYLSFVRALEARGDDFSFDDIYGMLLSEELRQQKLTKHNIIEVFCRFLSP